MKKIYASLFAFLLCTAIDAQMCAPYGNGSDGAYTATSNTTLAGGTYNYTSFTINAGVTVSVTGTQPLIILCSGAATINGALRADGGNGANGITFSSAGAGGTAVAGGYNGGGGTYSSSLGPLNGSDGFGSGGVNTHGGGWSGGGGAGYATNGSASGSSSGGFGGPAYGNAQLSSLTGGSGGGGGSGGYSCGSGGGGAGGGVIFIGAQTSLTIGASGLISCNGGNGGSDGTGNCGGGGGGSGGTIWLLSPSMTNGGIIQANYGTGGASNVPGSPYYGTGANGAVGRIRLDYNGTLSGSGSTTPAVGYHAAAQTQQLSSAISGTNIQCFGSANGSALVTATGGSSPYTYSWSPSGGTNASATNLAAGGYTCTVTDANGCTTTPSVTITEPTQVMVSVANSSNVTCNGACNGSFTVTATGGTPPYAYLLLPLNLTGSVFTNLCAGTYSVTVTDSYGCMGTMVTTVTEPTAISTSVSSSNGPTTCSGADGSITVTTSGGSPGYTYQWSNGSISNPVMNLTSGNYTYTVTDANGCSNSVNTTITDPAPPSVSVTLNVDTACMTVISNPITLSGGSPSGGTYSGPGVSAGVFDANNANIGWNTITYSYTDQVTQCSAVSTDSIFVDQCLGIVNAPNDQLRWYPNPATQQLFIEISGTNNAKMTVEIYDVHGSIASRQNLAVSDGRMIADVQQLTTGIYFVRIYNGSDMKVLRFEKQ